MTNPVWGSVGSPISSLTGSVTPVLPAHVAGDLIFIVAEHANASNAITPTLGGGTAFALLGAQTNSTTTSGLACWWAKATSSAMTAPAIGGNAGQDHIYAVAFVISGAQNIVGDNPWATFVVANLAATASTSGTGSTLGSVNAANALIVDIVSRGSDSAAATMSGWANSGLANVTERFDAGTTDGNGGGLGIATGELAAPATLAATTVTFGGSNRWASISIALRSTVLGTATVTGVSKAGTVGTLSATAGAGTALTGVQAAGSAGTLAASGGVVVTPVTPAAVMPGGVIGVAGPYVRAGKVMLSGARARGAAGVLSATTAARVLLAGIMVDALLGRIDVFMGARTMPAKGRGRVGIVDAIGIHEISDDEIAALLAAIEG